MAKAIAEYEEEQAERRTMAQALVACGRFADVPAALHAIVRWPHDTHPMTWERMPEPQAEGATESEIPDDEFARRVHRAFEIGASLPEKPQKDEAALADMQNRLEVGRLHGYTLESLMDEVRGRGRLW